MSVSSEKLEFILKEKNFSLRRLAQLIGCVPQNLYDISTEKIQRFSPKLAGKISSRFPEYTIKWLLSGDNQPLVTDNHSVGLPYYDVDFTSSFLEVYNSQVSVPQSFIQISQLQIKGAVWCNNIGCSMEPEIYSGDKILLKEIDDWQNCLIFNEIYAVVTTNGLRTIKRIKKGDDKDLLTLIPANPEYEKQQIKKNTIMKMFKVLATIRTFVIACILMLSTINVFAQNTIKDPTDVFLRYYRLEGAEHGVSLNGKESKNFKFLSNISDIKANLIFSNTKYLDVSDRDTAIYKQFFSKLENIFTTYINKSITHRSKMVRVNYLNNSDYQIAVNVNVKMLDKHGNLYCVADFLDIKRGQLLGQWAFIAKGGMYGDAENLLEDGAQSCGEMLGRFIAEKSNLKEKEKNTGWNKY